MTTHLTQRSRFRATSIAGSRSLRATTGNGVMTLPPSSRMAISNVEIVRSDGLSKSSATCAPPSAFDVGALRPERALALHARGQRQAGLELGRLEVEHGEEILCANSDGSVEMARLKTGPTFGSRR